MTKSDIYSIRPTQSTHLGKLGAQAWLRRTTLQTLQTLMYRYIEGLHELQDNAMSIAYTHQMLSNEEQDAEACGEPHGSEDSARLHTLTP